MNAKGIAPVHDFDEPKLEALIEVMFLAAYADGEFSEEERAHFAKSVESLSDRRVTGEAFDALLARMQGDLDGAGRDARLGELKAVLGSEAACRVALSLAIRLMAADGIIRTSERELIVEMAEALSIEPDVAADLVTELSSQ